ncbi:MAG TPA: hypothetical protein VIT21_01895 [Chthoniobacterales bacterium]
MLKGVVTTSEPDERMALARKWKSSRPGCHRLAPSSPGAGDPAIGARTLTYSTRGQQDNIASLEIPFSPEQLQVFISWNVQQAGATTSNFSFRQRHSKFVHDAIVGANSQPAFRGRRRTDYKPKVGDIIQNNRNGNSFDFDHAAPNDAYFYFGK